MIDSLLLAIGFLAVLMASFFDVLTLEIPPSITWGTFWLALAIRLVSSAASGYDGMLLSGLTAFAFTFIPGILFVVCGLWGGGDSKLLWAISATLGASDVYASFLLNLILVGGCYGLLMVLYKRYHPDFGIPYAPAIMTAYLLALYPGNLVVIAAKTAILL